MEYSDIVIDIRRIVRSINLESKRILKDFGVSIPQLLSLQYLKHCKDCQCTHRALTNFLHLNSSTVTGIVNRLERNGLVARLPKKDDKRNTYLTLTSKGSGLLDKIPHLAHQRLSDNLQKLDAGTVESLRNSLAVLTHALDIGQNEPE